MARFTIFMRNGKAIDFESSKVSVSTDTTSGSHRVVHLTAQAKDNGLTLIFAATDQIDAIVRDTSKEYE